MHRRMTVARQPKDIPEQLTQALTQALSVEIYDNTVVPEMEKWLKTSQSLDELAANVTAALRARWPEIEARVNSLGSSQSSQVGRDLSQSSALQLSSLADQAAVPISAVLGVVLSTIGGTLLGGGG